MKNTFKRFIAGASVVAVMSAGSVFATEATPINEEAPSAGVVEENIPVNAPVEPYVSVFEKIDGTVMLPVRAVAEHFGYTVEWIEESQSVTLTKGAVYVIFSINENSYAFSRMAPQELEAAPVLVNDETTYVPASLFTELLGLNASETEDGIVITQPRIVTVVSMDAENKTITVMDDFYGEVVANITDETVITANGEEVIGFAVGEGALIEIEYANFMTMSIPPQTNAVSIELLNQPVDAE